MTEQEVVRRILRDKKAFISDYKNLKKNKEEQQAYEETLEQWDVVIQWGKNEQRRKELIEKYKEIVEADKGIGYYESSKLQALEECEVDYD
jgi:uncharacterized tellurite resistance protein B-like protein